MLEFVLTGLILLLATALCFAGYFLWKFAKIIMVFEDDLDDALEGLSSVENSIAKVLDMQMFFDSPEVRKSVQIVLEDIKLCKGIMNGIIHKFTARSNHKYITTWEEEQFTDIQAQQRLSMPRLPGQPPGTPNPLEELQREGMVLDVRH